MKFSKGTYLVLFLLLAAGAFFLAKNQLQKSSSPQNTEAPNSQKSYWTCPMHPHIRSEIPSECPICHMKLVQVKEDSSQAMPADSQREKFKTSPYQLELASGPTHQVEKMSLKVKIPVAGRLISSDTAAFQIYESDLHRIRPGLKFKGVSSVIPDYEISGTIISVDNFVDPTSRTLRVLGRVENKNSKLITETTLSGSIEIEVKDQLFIPESSVLHTGQSDLVYVLFEDHTLAPQKVHLGLKAEGYYELLSGLEEGDIISGGPNFLFDSEAKIRGAR